jgi:organic radical activating enzyme
MNKYNVITELNKGSDLSYPVMEHYYTLQGEGFHSGKAAWFLRLGGCDVGCVWCDVKESWDASLHPTMTVAEIINIIKGFKAQIAVITGGEPAMYNLTAVSDAMHVAGIKVHIETSGAYPILGNIDWITVSPKKFKSPLKESLAKANELKVVIFNKSDFVWAEQNAAMVSADCKLFLQPEWSKKEKINQEIIDYIKENPQWQLSLQTHKYINIS